MVGETPRKDDGALSAMHQTGTVICPSGKKTFARENLSSPARKKIPLRDDPKSNLHFSPSRSHKRGASRSSRTLEAGCDGRGSRRRICATNDAIADGEIAWSWRPDAGAKLAERSADDGGKKARSPGRSRISRNTIVQGMPAVAVYPWLLTPVLFAAQAATGATRIRHSLRPLMISRAVYFQHLGRNRAARTRSCIRGSAV
jgi:hypothetical protein